MYHHIKTVKDDLVDDLQHFYEARQGPEHGKDCLAIVETFLEDNDTVEAARHNLNALLEEKYGLVTPKDLAAFFVGLGHEGEAEAYMMKFDDDKSGKLDFEEFSRMCRFIKAEQRAADRGADAGGRSPRMLSLPTLPPPKEGAEGEEGGRQQAAAAAARARRPSAFDDPDDELRTPRRRRFSVRDLSLDTAFDDD